MSTLEQLFKATPAAPKEMRVLWFYARKDSDHLRGMVSEWRRKLVGEEKAKDLLVPRISTPTPTNVPVKEYDFALWMPFSDQSTYVCAEALKRVKPFAILMDSILVSRVAQKANGEYDPELMKGVKECKKIALLNAEMTWLLYKIPEAMDRVMVSRVWILESVFDQADRDFPIEEYRGIIPRPFVIDTKEWVKEQQGVKEEYA